MPGESHPGHAHPHLHPHRKGKDHHHTHRHPHPDRPDRLAHHHPIPGWRQPRVPYCTDGIARIWRAVYRWFPRAVNLGTFNCRKIAGTQVWSQHAWADAWDVASTQSAKTLQPDAYLDAIVEYLQESRGRLGISSIIYRSRGHYSHAHVDVPPVRTGTPPCA